MEDIKGCGSVLDQYFDSNTMSVHMKEGIPTMKKCGGPGHWDPILSEEILSKQELEGLITKVFQEVESRDDSYLEIDRAMSKVIQLAVYRIVIAYPPLADGLEMTVVKPVKKLSLSDYNLDQEVVDLLQNTSKGILISGAPGSGKTTFAQALVDMYIQDKNIIKTLESPRDLMVPDEVVQYSFTYASHEELRDILLLSRPDFTVYDEVRNKPDFELYKDLRLTGIGLIGAIHATKPIDGIQRFLGSIELGLIPQVLDTVIFIDKGEVGEILELKLLVKIPAGMMSEDLARPVIVISSFFDKRDIYEIYSFGEQIVVMSLEDIPDSGKTSVVAQYAKDSIDKKLAIYLNSSFISKIIGANRIELYVPVKTKASVIGKAGKNIQELEKILGMSIDVMTLEEIPLANIETKTQKDNNTMVISFPKGYMDQEIYLLVEGEVYRLKTNDDSNIVIKKKQLVSSIDKKGFNILNLEK